jgi:hypothetical protein
VSNLAGLGQLLQGIGVTGILVVMLVMLNRGSLFTRAAHQEIVAALMSVTTEQAREIARLEQEVSRLSAALSVRGDDD